MLKFLRLYQGWILAVFGTFLVITFLLPQAITGLFESYAVTGGDWATVEDGETISNGEYIHVQNELRVLERIGNPILNAMGADREPAYWYLLAREADQAGLVGGNSQGREYIAQMSQQLATAGRQVSETELLMQMMGSASPSFTDREVYNTLAKVSGVQELARQFQSAARFSDERLRQAAAEMSLTAIVDFVVLDARKDGTEAEPTEIVEALVVETPSEAVLVEQFEAHKAENEGEGSSGFGYVLPNRARLEWIRVSKDAVRAAVEANAQIDSIELRKKFLNNPASFGAIINSPDGPPKFTDYEQTVRDAVLAEELLERMAQIEKFLGDQTQLARRGLDRQGMTYVLPEDWSDRQADFNELSASLAEEFQLEAPPTRQVTDGLVSATEIDQLDGLGAARSSKFGRVPMSVSQFVMNAREFGDENSAIPVQEGISGPVFKDATGDLFIFRIIDTDPTREAVSIDEVREQVTRDATDLARFRTLESRASELKQNAVDYGLTPIAEQYGAEVRFQQPISEADSRLLGFGLKQPSRVIGVNDPMTVIDAITARAAELDYTVPAADIPVEERTLVIADEENLVVVVAQIQQIKPLTNEAWKELSANAGIVRVLISEEAAVNFVEAFSLEELMKRHNFKSLRASEDDDDLLDEAMEEGLDATPADGEEIVETAAG